MLFIRLLGTSPTSVLAENTPCMSPPPFFGRLTSRPVKGIYCESSPCNGRVKTPASPPTHLTTHHGFLPLPGHGPLSCCSHLVLRHPLLSPNETQGAHHCFGLTNIFLQHHHTEHPYHYQQGFMDSDGIMPRYASVIYIKNDVGFSRLPTQPLMCLLRTADSQQNHPYHCIQHDVDIF